jgi:hypothetical protein
MRRVTVNHHLCHYCHEGNSTLKHYSQYLQERGKRTFIQSCRQHSVLAGKGQGQAEASLTEQTMEEACFNYCWNVLRCQLATTLTNHTVKNVKAVVIFTDAV